MDNLRRTATKNLARRIERAERRSNTTATSCKPTILSARSAGYRHGSQQSCAPCSAAARNSSSIIEKPGGRLYRAKHNSHSR